MITQTNRMRGRVAVISDPAAIRRIFVDNAANYIKDELQRRMLTPGRPDGLITAEGTDWRVQRRALAPIFTPLRNRPAPRAIFSRCWSAPGTRRPAQDSAKR